MKTILFFLCMFCLLRKAGAKQPTLSPVDGIFVKGEFIDVDLATNKRLYIRYSPISDHGARLELMAGPHVIWRAYVAPPGFSGSGIHISSSFSEVVAVEIEPDKSKLDVTITGSRVLHEVRSLKTGKLLSRKVKE